jgi:hypothetical protein
MAMQAADSSESMAPIYQTTLPLILEDRNVRFRFLFPLTLKHYNIKTQYRVPEFCCRNPSHSPFQQFCNEVDAKEMHQPLPEHSYVKIRQGIMVILYVFFGSKPGTVKRFSPSQESRQVFGAHSA